MAPRDNSVFRAARARTEANAPTRSITHSSRAPRARGGQAKKPAPAARTGKPAPAGGRGGAAPSSTGTAKKGGAGRNLVQLASPGNNPTKRKAASAAGPTGRAVSSLPDLSAPTVIRKKLKPGGRLTAGNPRRLLLVEYLICFTVLGAGTIVAPQGQGAGVPRLMVRGTALSILFLILALISAMGAKASKAAGALGGLVTLTYVVSSQDGVNLFKWMKGFFSQAGLGDTPVPAAQSTGSLGQVGQILASAVNQGTFGGDPGALGQVGQDVQKFAEHLAVTPPPDESRAPVPPSGAAAAE